MTWNGNLEQCNGSYKCYENNDNQIQLKNTEKDDKLKEQNGFIYLAQPKSVL